MKKQEAELLYTLHETPPFPALMVLAFQHIFLMSSTLVLPVILFSEIGGTIGEISSIVALTMITSGLGTILQSFGKGWMGAGYLCPNLCGPNFFAAATNAVWLGGMPLLRGMVIISGLFEIVFARCFHWFKFLFPTEITGLVVFMIALSLIPVGTSKFIGMEYAGGVIDPLKPLIATITLLVMLVVNIAGYTRWRLYSVFVGLIVGYGLCIVTGLLTMKDISAIEETSWFGLPTINNFYSISFNWSLLPTFIIVSLCGALKTFGNLMVCAKINGHNYTNPDPRRVSNGLFADGVAVTVSGLLGSMPSDTSASNVALSGASGAASKIIGVVAGIIFIFFGFSPKLSAIFSVIPDPVSGAILIFVAAFMIISSLQIIVRAGTELHKMLTIGIAAAFGISMSILPDLYASIPPGINALFDSPLTFSTIVAIILSQIFRLCGVRQGLKK